MLEYIFFAAKLGRNISLVFLLLFALGAMIPRLRAYAGLCANCLIGIGFGVAGVAAMLVPVEIVPGVIVDGRVIMGALGALYGSLPGAALSVVLILVFRIFLGGAGMVAGIGTIVTAGIVGLLLRRYLRGDAMRLGWAGFVGLGGVLAVEVLVWAFALPAEVRAHVFADYTLPLVGFYMVSSLLFGLVISHELRRHEAEHQLRCAKDELEVRVEERTSALRKANLKLGEAIRRRKESEAELAKKEEHYRLIVERMPDVIFRYDRRARHVFAGANVERNTGIKAEEYLGKTHTELGYPEEQSEFRRNLIMSVFESGLPREKEFEMDSLKDGHRLFINWRLYPEKDSLGEVESVLVISRDVTRRRLAEEALRESEEAYRELVEGSQSIILRMDPRGNVIFLNEFGLDFFGFTREELLGRNVIGTIVPETDSSGASMYVMMEKILKDPDRMLYNENENIRKNGERAWVYWANKPVFGPDGELNEIVSIGTDATARREAQEALRKLRRAVEQSPLSIVITDAEGTIEYVNPFFCAVTGYTCEEAVSMPMRIVKSGVHSEDFYKEMWTTISAGDIWRGEICNKRKSGELFWELASISPVRSASGEITHYIAVKEDITERRKTEALREDVNRIIQHDLKAPINGFINLPELMLADDNLTDEQRELLDVIRATGERMLDMVNISGDIFRMESGTYQPRRNPVDLVPVLRKVLDEGPGESVVDISVSGREGMNGASFTVLGDPSQYRSLILNLVMNALEASPRGQRIHISMVQDNDEGVISIRNTGAVPKAVRANFFEKYITYGKERGTGLGTYAARLMAEANLGSISMETDDEADSTTVTVRLPISTAVRP